VRIIVFARKDRAQLAHTNDVDAMGEGLDERKSEKNFRLRRREKATLMRVLTAGRCGDNGTVISTVQPLQLLCFPRTRSPVYPPVPLWPFHVRDEHFQRLTSYTGNIRN